MSISYYNLHPTNNSRCAHTRKITYILTNNHSAHKPNLKSIEKLIKENLQSSLTRSQILKKL
jgi:hypothetical protein